MTIELLALFGVTVILFFAILVQQIAIDRKYGAKFALSNRGEVPGQPSEAVERLTRMVRNHVEGIAVFAPLVLIATLAEVSNNFTQIAALVYLATRALHFLFYAFGVTPFRSFAWGLGFMLTLPVFGYGLISGAGAAM